MREIARRLRTGLADAYAASRTASRTSSDSRPRSCPRQRSAPSTPSGSRSAHSFTTRVTSSRTSKFGEALAIVADREQSFWLDRDVGRKAQWEASRRMAEPGIVAMDARKPVDKTAGDAVVWMDAYVPPRTVGTVSTRRSVGSRPGGKPGRGARRTPARGGASRLRGRLPGDGGRLHQGADEGRVDGADTLHQTRIWSEIVADRPKPVAYFLIDAMRFEMGVELAERLPKDLRGLGARRCGRVTQHHADRYGGAAARGAASCSVVEQGGRLGARIDDGFLPDLATRKKARGCACAEARRRCSRRAAEPPAVEAREEDRRRAGRSSSARRRSITR